jgi:hypothetical protein
MGGGQVLGSIGAESCSKSGPSAARRALSLPCSRQLAPRARSAFPTSPSPARSRRPHVTYGCIQARKQEQERGAHLFLSLAVPLAQHVCRHAPQSMLTTRRPDEGERGVRGGRGRSIKDGRANHGRWVWMVAHLLLVRSPCACGACLTSCLWQPGIKRLSIRRLHTRVNLCRRATSKATPRVLLQATPRVLLLLLPSLPPTLVARRWGKG